MTKWLILSTAHNLVFGVYDGVNNDEAIAMCRADPGQQARLHELAAMLLQEKIAGIRLMTPNGPYRAAWDVKALHESFARDPLAILDGVLEAHSTDVLIRSFKGQVERLVEGRMAAGEETSTTADGAETFESSDVVFGLVALHVACTRWPGDSPRTAKVQIEVIDPNEPAIIHGDARAPVPVPVAKHASKSA